MFKPKSYTSLGILCEVSSSLGPWEYFGICKDWVLEKEISRQSDVPIILVLEGTPTLHIVDEHVISFTPTNTKFQKKCVESHKLIFTPESPLLHYLGRYSFFSYNFSFLFEFFLRVAYLLADFLAVYTNFFHLDRS